MTWVDLIAGAYISLFLVMAITGGTFLAAWVHHWRNISPATALLYCGIALSFSGHALDQGLWSVSNIDRALAEGDGLRLSTWYAQNIPLVVVGGKFLASLGALLHLRLFTVSRIPFITVPVMALLWAAVSVGSAFFLAVLRS